LEVTRDLVAPAPRHAGLVVAGERTVLVTEDVVRVMLEVVAIEDEVVGLVDLGELAAAAAPEDDVHHHRRAGHRLAALAVVPPQQLLAQAAVEVAAEEAGGDQEHAYAAGDQEVERAAHEVREGALLLIKIVGVLAGHRAALAVGRVRDDEAEGALIAGALI